MTDKEIVKKENKPSSSEHQFSQSISAEVQAFAIATIKAMEKRDFDPEKMHVTAMTLVDIASKLYIEHLQQSGQASEMGERQTLSVITPNFHHSVTPINSQKVDSVMQQSNNIKTTHSGADQERMISKILASTPAQFFDIKDKSAAITALARAVGMLFLELSSDSNDDRHQTGKVRFDEYDIQFQITKAA